METFNDIPHDQMWHWSNTKLPPKIGDVVKVNFNGLGFGTIQYYFVHDQYLGVGVKPAHPPAWWVKVNTKLGRTCYEVYGAEVEY